MSNENIKVNPLTNIVAGDYTLNKPLAKYTSWRIGGPAKAYFRPKDIADLQNFFRAVPIHEKLLFLGLGSNILLPDSGFGGTVIHIFKTLDKIEILTKNDLEKISCTLGLDEVLVRIESGTTCAKIAKFCEKNNIIGGEFFAGIPGTMGGALKMNAGAFGSETWEFVEFVDLINRKGELTTRDKSEFEISYRSTNNLKADDEYFVAGLLKFKTKFNVGGNQEIPLKSKIKDLLTKRNHSQPIGQLSCGSVFKNPPGNYAAKLIEASKLKGKRIGNACVSNKHANFIINLGCASSKDVEQLINLIQETVLKDHGVRLELEVEILSNKKGVE